ncbi:MAG: hypothetical protein ACC662_12335, partial [Planctomycetota bacterium]
SDISNDAEGRVETTRRLLFDEHGLLGHVDERRDVVLRVRAPVGRVHEWAFTGVHVVSPAFLEQIEERGAFSILAPYLRLAGAGARILPFRVDGCRWIDVGRPADLRRARQEADG